MGDPRLGPDQPARFLPTRFTVGGDAIDSSGAVCHGLACPRCHLEIPRALLEFPPMFLSILGSPASGKSYFLTSMTWQLRQTLPKYFAFSFSDADPATNQILNEYEEQQFLSADRDELVAIRKTELQGDSYETVILDDRATSFPRPFIFAFRPTDAHPNKGIARKISRAICLYDNAGEHFLPGSDKSSTPVTHHLALSRILFFLFDPTQDPRFREACRHATQDPQMHDASRTLRQESVLLEAASRIRKYTGLGQHEKHRRPLVVVVTKFDAWRVLLDCKPLDSDPWRASKDGQLSGVNTRIVEDVSGRVRNLLLELTPEIVSVAEDFAETVLYIPVSATGCSPEVDPNSGALGIRPRDLNPIWVETPILYGMARWMRGLIPMLRPKGDADSERVAGARSLRGNTTEDSSEA